MRTLGLLFGALTLLSASPAFAQDDDDEDEAPVIDEDTFNLDDFDEFDNDDDEPEVERLEEGDDDIPFEDEEIDDEDYIPTEGGELDFGDELDELGDDEVGGAGQDNAAIYRDHRDNMNDLGPEEELISWERYLEDYPNSLFRERIEVRMEELTDELYKGRIDDPRDGYEDAKDREIEFAHGMQLENIDPRTRLRAGFEIGLGSYYSGMLDFEYQLMRQWSVHAGARRRYTGGNLEVGTRYALVKSARLNMLVTGIFDLHYNTNPGYLGVRPVIAAGKRFDVGNGLDVQAQVGMDLEVPGVTTASKTGRQGGVRYIGGLNAHYQASDVVAFFLEGSVNMKHIGWDDGSAFVFNVMSFGLKFTPGKQPATIGLNANVPFAYNYWGYHFGAVQGDVLYYFDDVGGMGR